MNITITVSSLEELESFAAALLRQKPPIKSEATLPTEPPKEDKPASDPAPKASPKASPKAEPEAKPEQPAEAKPEQPAKPDPAPAASAPADTGGITLVELRKMMKACMDAGRREPVMTLLTSFGASKLSQVESSRWPELAQGLTQILGDAAHA